MILKVTFMGGPQDGKELSFANLPITIGRSPENDVAIPDDRFISRQHARLSLEDDGCYLVDLNGVNGTYLGEARIYGKCAVPPGGLIQIGRTMLKVDQDDR